MYKSIASHISIIFICKFIIFLLYLGYTFLRVCWYYGISLHFAVDRKVPGWMRSMLLSLFKGNSSVAALILELYPNGSRLVLYSVEHKHVKYKCDASLLIPQRLGQCDAMPLLRALVYIMFEWYCILNQVNYIRLCSQFLFFCF